MAALTMTRHRGRGQHPAEARHHRARGTVTVPRRGHRRRAALARRGRLLLGFITAEALYPGAWFAWRARRRKAVLIPPEPSFQPGALSS